MPPDANGSAATSTGPQALSPPMRLPMRSILIVVAGLAVAKVYAQDHFVRASFTDALIAAYSEKAQQICAREGAKHGAATPAAWSAARDAHVTIGGKVASVMIWDYSNPLWAVRYRNPHLVLSASGSRKLKCSFDVSAGVAFVQVL